MAASGSAGQISVGIQVENLIPTKAQIKGLGTEFKSMGQQLTQGLSPLSAVTGETSNQINKLTAGTRQYSTTVTSSGRAIEGNTAAHTRNVAAISENTKRVTGFASAIGRSMFGVFGITAATAEFIGMQGMLRDSTTRVNEMQERYNVAVELYGENSRQATQAGNQLAQAQRGLAMANRNTMLSMFDVVFWAGNLSSQALPKVVEGIGKLRLASSNAGGFVNLLSNSFAGLRDRFDRSSTSTADLTRNLRAGQISIMGFGSNVDKTSASMTRSVGAFGRLRGAAGGLTGIIGGPLGIALIAAGTALAIIGTNAFGARDALDSVGSALGDAFPVLVPFLEGVRDLAELMGIAPVNIERTTKSVQDQNKVVEESGGFWADYQEELLTSTSRISREAGIALDDLSTKIDEQAKATDQAMEDQAASFDKFRQQLESNDISGAAETLFSSIVGTINTRGADIEQELGIIGGFFKFYGLEYAKSFENFGIGFDQHVIQPIQFWAPRVGALAQEVGRQLVTNLLGEIQSIGMDDVVQTFIVDPMNSVGSLIGVEGLGDKYIQLITTGWGKLQQIIKTEIVDRLNNIPGQIKDIGQQIWDGLGFGWLQTQLSTLKVPDWMTGGLANLFPNIPEAGAEEAPAPTPTPSPPTGFTKQDPRHYRPSTFQDGYAPGWGPTYPTMQRAQFVTPQTQPFAPPPKPPGLVGSAVKEQAGKLYGREMELAREQIAISTTYKGLETDVESLNLAYTDAVNILETYTQKTGQELPPSLLANKQATVELAKSVIAERDATQESYGSALGYLAVNDKLHLAKNLNMKDTIALVDTMKEEAGANEDLVNTEASVGAALDELAEKRRDQQILVDGSISAEQRYNDARDAGLKKGAEFVNNLKLNNVTMDAYRQKLEEGINGQTGWSNSMGLTTHQLELMNRRMHDTTDPLDKIIDQLADQVFALEDNKLAWEGLDAAEQQNINTLLDQKQALVEAQQPLADNAENAMKLRDAYITGQQAANDFAIGMRTQAAQTEGTNDRLEALIKTFNPGFTNAIGMTTQELQTFLGFLEGIPAEVDKVTQSVLEAGRGLTGMLQLEEGELENSIKDAFKDVPKWMKEGMSRELKGGILEQAEIESITGDLVSNIGAALTGAMRTENPMGTLREYMTSQLDELRSELDPGVEKAMEPVFTVMEKMADSKTMEEALGWWQTLPAAVRDAIDPFDQIQGALEGTNKAFRDGDKVFNIFTGRWEKINDTLSPAEEALSKFNTTAATTATNAESAGNALGTFIPGLTSVGTEASGAKGPVDSLNESIGAIMEKINQARESIPGFIANVTSQIMGGGQQLPTPTTPGTTQQPTQTVPTVDTTGQIASLNALNEAFQAVSTSALTLRNNVQIMHDEVSGNLVATGEFATQMGSVTTSAFNASSTSALTLRNNVQVMHDEASENMVATGDFASEMGGAITAGFNASSTSALTFRNNIQVMHDDSSENMLATGEASADMGGEVTTSFNASSRSALTFRNNVEQAAEDTTSAMDEIVQAAQDADGPFTNALNAMSRAALNLRNNVDEASGAVGDLKSEIDSLESKEITVTTRFRTIGSPPAGARQHGGVDIITRPTWKDGILRGEMSKPEALITIPLTDPNNLNDKTIDLNRLAGSRAPRPESLLTGIGGGIGLGGIRIQGGSANSNVPSMQHIHLHIGDREIASVVIPLIRQEGGKRQNWYVR